jgi:hypothetical protein
LSAEPTAARAAHVLHERPTDPALVLDLLSAASARLDAEAPGPQVLVVVPDADAALAVADLARDVPAARGLLPVTSVKRALRLLPSAPAIVVGGLADLGELLRRSALKLERIGQVIVLEAERLDAEAGLATLDALLAELPKDATRTVVAATVSDAVRDLAERHLHRARRLAAPAAGGAVPPSLQVLVATPATRAGALARLLDDLDPPSVTIVADRAADRDAAADAVARLGLPPALASVVGATGTVPEHVAVAVLWGIPSARALAAVAAAQPARVVAIVGARERHALAAAASGAGLVPYVPAESSRAVRAADARLRSALREELARGTPLRELGAIEPLFDHFEPADVAAAAVRLLDAARATLAAAKAAPPPAVATAVPAVPPARETGAPTSDRPRDRGGDRSAARGGDRSAARGGDRGAARGAARGGDRGGSRGPRDAKPPFRGGAKRPATGGARGRDAAMRDGPKGFGRGRPPRGPEEGGPRKDWQDRGERLRNAKRRRDT